MYSKILIIGVSLLMFTACDNKGSQGPYGARGADGQTITGPQGVAGTNCTVEQIDEGARITCGDTSALVEKVTGPQGPSGNNGSNGSDGIAGPPGSMGPPGLVGATGPTGSPGANGRDGAPGLDGKDSQVPGPQGPSGNNGRDGERGPPGDVGPAGPKGKDAVLPTFVTICHVPKGNNSKRHSLIVPDFVAEQLTVNGPDYMGECL